MILKTHKQGIIGFTCSTFDLFHAGHNLMLREAKFYCDYLLVGLQTDPTIDRPNTKNPPIQSVVERQIQLMSNHHVDEIVVYQTEKDLENILLTYPIDIRIIGIEYKHKEFTGKQICIDKNIHIIYNKRDHFFSSSELRKRIEDASILRNNKNG